jgi:hypothetical protein
MTLLVVRRGFRPAEEAMGESQDALTRTLEADGDLSVVELTTGATILGAFQRPCDAPRDLPQLARGSGGPWVRAVPGTIHVLLLLRDPAALVPCDPRRILNRYVRPLLRGLTKAGALAHYFGREWVSAEHRPVAQVGFAHDTRSRRTAFEAFVATAEPLMPGGRPSLMGKEPLALPHVDRQKLALRITEAYAAIAGETTAVALTSARRAGPAREEPPWAHVAEEAIGQVAAGTDAAGVLRLGGDLLASGDAVERVAARVAALDARTPEAVGRVVDEELAGPSVALEGIRDLSSLRGLFLE